jgi:hypothetical protein
MKSSMTKKSHAWMIKCCEDSLSDWRLPDGHMAIKNQIINR